MREDRTRRWTFKVRQGFERYDNYSPDDWEPTNKFSADHKAFIVAYLDRPSVQNRDLAIDLRKQFPGIVFSQRQLRSCRYRLRKLANKGYRAFLATMKLLDEQGIKYEVKWAEGSDNTKPEGMFWSTEWS